MKYINNFVIFEASKKELKENFEEVCLIFMDNLFNDDSFLLYKKQIFVEKDLYKDLLVDHENYFSLGDNDDVNRSKSIKLSDKEKDKIFYNLLVNDVRAITDKSSEKDIFNKSIKETNSKFDNVSKLNFLPTLIIPLFDVNEKKAKSILKKYYDLHHKEILKNLKVNKIKLYEDHISLLNNSNKGIIEIINNFYDNFKDDFSTAEKFEMSTTYNELFVHLVNSLDNFFGGDNKHLDDLSKLGIFDD